MQNNIISLHIKLFPHTYRKQGVAETGADVTQKFSATKHLLDDAAFNTLKATLKGIIQSNQKYL